MEIKIEISPTMDKETGWNDEYEHRIIRIPASYREKLGLAVGDQKSLRNKDGVWEYFQVSEAFKEDVARDADCVYVTQKVYDRLSMKEATIGLMPVSNITLGCDPEAFLVDKFTNNIVSAHRYFSKYGEVGNDGLLLEFRPNPSIYATEVCDNLWRLIQRASTQLAKKPEANRIAIMGRSSFGGLTTGFHLHYGFPKPLLTHKSGNYNRARLMTTVFDYYVGITSIIPEGNTDTGRRTAKYVAYGKPGEFRLDGRTFEFRMPGGVNLVHPVLTRGLLALGAVVAEDVVTRINSCTDCFRDMQEINSPEDFKALYPNLPGPQMFYTTICNEDIGLARRHFETIKRDVRKMVGYDKRNAAVEEYFECLDRNVVFGSNIEENWGGFYNGEKQQGQMVVL